MLKRKCAVLFILSIFIPFFVQASPNRDLRYAAGRGNIEEAKRALKAGADVNCLEGLFEKETPLYAAVSFGQTDMITLLLAVPNIRPNIPCETITNRDLPIHAAAENGRISVLRQFHIYNQEITKEEINRNFSMLIEPDRTSRPLEEEEIPKKELVNFGAQNTKRETPLSIAVRKRDIEMVTTLLEWRTSSPNGTVSVSLPNEIHYVILSYLQWAARNNDMELAKLLLCYGSDPLSTPPSIVSKPPHELATNPELKKILHTAYLQAKAKKSKL